MAPGFIPQVRAASLQNYRNVARFVGIDPEYMLQVHKIRTGDKMDPDNKLAGATLVKLYEASAAAAGREDFGLLMAESRSFAALGPASLLLQYQPTIRAVIDQVIVNMRSFNDIVDAQLQDDARAAMIRIEMRPGFGSRQLIEATVAIACRTYRELSGGAWQPERIHFRHSPPADVATHWRVFRAPISFDSEFDGIVCSSASLDIANPWSDSAMAAHAQRFLDMLAHQRSEDSVTEQARRAIFLLIGSGHATREKVAENLAMHPRALQRSLSREGTGFGVLLNEAKHELALRYLNASRQSVTEIALLLGYSTISSFTRWFTEEFGMSPAAWRRAPPRDVIVAFTARAA